MKAGLAALSADAAPPSPRPCCCARCATAWASRACARAATGGAALGPDTFRFFLAHGRARCASSTARPSSLGAYTHARARRRRFRHRRRRLQRRHQDHDRQRRTRNGVGEIVTPPSLHVPGLLQEPRRDAPPTCATAGCIPATPATSTPRASWSSSTACRTSPPRRAATRFSPQYIENKLKFSPYIAEAVVLGDERDYLAAIVCIRFSIVSQVGRAEPHLLHHLHRSREPAGGLRPDRRRGRARECLAAAGAADPQVHAALQGARRRRRRADPHPQGAPRRHRREIRRHHRGDLRRRAAIDDRHQIAFQDGTTPAHPHHAAPS